MKMPKVLICSDKTEIAKELLSAALLIGKDVYGVSINNDEQAGALAACGAQVLKINDARLSPVDTGAMAAALGQVVEKMSADVVLLSSNRTGKELAGRLAQLLDAGCLADVGKITVKDGIIECSRNALGGATVAVQAIKTARKVMSISPRAFSPAGAGPCGSISQMNVEVKSFGIKLLETREKNLERVDIEAADALVAVGQGMEDQNMLAQVSEIAAALHAEVACSKPVATDKKWLSEERVIGISGKICKPALALLFGISGQVQFTVGIRDAKTIVVVNKDENAAICDMADYVMIADLKDAIPALKDSLVKQ